MKRSKFFAPRGPRYLRVADIAADDVPYVIKNVRAVMIGDPKEMKPVLDFHGVPQALLLNATNWDVLEAALGPESDDWIGHKVYLSVEQGKLRSGPEKGKPYETIRVRVVVEAADRPRPAPAADRPVSATANGHDRDADASAPPGDRDD
jgi:hypothetical protein